MRRAAILRMLLSAVFAACACGAAAAQEPASREEAIEHEQDAKASALKPAEPGKAEQYVSRFTDVFVSGLALHPYWESAYSGGGFTVGAGYLKHVSSYNTVDVRGSLTFSGYTRVEAEFIAPGLFTRRGQLSVLGGWRRATQVGFYGFGMNNTKDERANYGFEQPHVGAQLDMYPAGPLFLRGGLELSRWKQNPGGGDEPSVDQIYTPSTLPGLGTQPVYWHTQGTVGVDWRSPSSGYARRGGFYGVTVHDRTDTGGTYGFNQVDYEAIQHVPILRDAWVLSLHAMAQTTYDKGTQTIPFFMMPSIGGGSNLRAYASWRLRDLNSLYFQGEWRVIVNRFVDMALFYDAGKVASRRADLDLNGLKSDAGIGFRFHGPAATALRIELAHGSEGFNLVFAASPVF